MGWILMQPHFSEGSHSALKKLEKTGEYDYGLSLKGPRLRPINFGSRPYKNYEVNYHDLIREIFVSRVEINKLHTFLRGVFSIGLRTIMLLVRV